MSSDSETNYVATPEQKLMGAMVSERQRQKSDEGWTAEHDLSHDSGELVRAALTYLSGEASLWPWEGAPKFGPRDLVKAGALLYAELDRQDEAKRRAFVAEVQG
jgi:hypothetical protein